MTITFVGSDSAEAGSGTADMTLTLPSHQADDFAIAYGRSDDDVPVLAISTAGWTELDQRSPTSDRDRSEAVFFRRFTSGSETNPTMTIDTSQEHSFSVHVFRGVDTTTAFDATPNFQFTEGTNDTTPTNPAITSATDDACLILLHGATHDDISVAGAPSTPAGMTIGETVLGTANDHRGQITAYLLDAGTAGTITPTAWTHTSNPTSVSDFSLYSLLLRAAVAGGGISGVGSSTFGGSAVLTAKGELTGSGTMSFDGAAALDGVGELSGAGVMMFGGVADLSGASGLAGVGSMTFDGTADLEGMGELAGTAAMVFGGDADLDAAGSGQISGAGAMVFGGAADLEGDGDLAGVGSIVFGGNADIDGQGELAGQGDLVFDGAATLGVASGGGGGLTTEQAQQLLEIWNDRGLDDSDPKTITEIVECESYDEKTNAITKEVRKVGDTTTITRT